MGKYEELKEFPAKQFRRLTGVQRETFEKTSQNSYGYDVNGKRTTKNDVHYTYDAFVS